MSLLKVRRSISKIINLRFLIILLVVISVFTTLGLKVFSLIIVNGTTYEQLLSAKREVYVKGLTAPRGRIYDRNYNLLVDNKPVPTIMYERKVKAEDEVTLAYEASKIINMNLKRITIRDKKDFWILLNPDASKAKITQEEYELFNERKLTNSDIYKMKLDRITDTDLASLNEEDLKALAVFVEMRRGNKIIKNQDVTFEELALISEKLEDLPGFDTAIDWERVYPYGDCFKTLLGRVSSTSQGIPSERAEEYLAKGYKLNDRVGISFIEYQYEEYLKGSDAIYRLKNGQYEVVDEGSRGNDIVLSIDINLQCGVEQILSEEITATKKEPLTEYFNKAYAIVLEPNTGQVLAISAKQYIKENGEEKIVDYSPGTFSSTVTPGSVVKGASSLVGYKYGALHIGDTMMDEPIKIAGTPEKKSWRNLGMVSDITALAQSSNVFQFKVAMKVAGANYVPNQPISIDPGAFKKYRDMYSEFGLGMKTGIDLPGEFPGYKSNSTLPGYLLDLAIGQYDTYTPIQLAQYINTIASNGYRIQPSLLKEVYEPTKSGSLDHLKFKNTPQIYNKVNVEQKYMDRIVKGFEAVMTNGTGVGYISNAFTPAGKTGTSESFADPDGDGLYSTQTVSKSFVGFAPLKDPKMSMVVISPDVTHPVDGRVPYTSNVNRRISSRISNLFFEKLQ